MSRASRTAAALLAAIALTVPAACDGQGDATTPASPEGSSARAPAVASQPPRFTGRQRVLLQAALPALGDAGCARAPSWVCSVDQDDSYVPLGTAAHATLVEARTHLADRHTSWTSVLRVDAASQQALATTRRTARAAGGLVLLMTPGRQVLAAAAPTTEVTAQALRFSDLTKPDAWDLVGLFPSNDRAE